LPNEPQAVIAMPERCKRIGYRKRGSASSRVQSGAFFNFLWKLDLPIILIAIQAPFPMNQGIVRQITRTREADVMVADEYLKAFYILCLHLFEGTIIVRIFHSSIINSWNFSPKWGNGIYA
jgi:hypothetical protein